MVEHMDHRPRGSPASPAAPGCRRQLDKVHLFVDPGGNPHRARLPRFQKNGSASGDKHLPLLPERGASTDPCARRAVSQHHT
jgi:hypothetical protein